MDSLGSLLVVQEHDLALDRLRHRHATLPERAQVAALEAEIAVIDADLETRRGPLADLARAQQRHEDEAVTLAGQAEAANTKLYSGGITSPKELQALQADVDMLRAHQAAVEEQAIVLMEQREPLETEFADVEAQRRARDDALGAARAALSSVLAEVDAEIVAEQARRDAAAAAVEASVLALYERCRADSPTRVGAARLVGRSCQGCHLTIPATEVAALRAAPPGTVAHCDNCGAILVP
ncbi:MAG: zinc ribbon domain-containing protein [Actinomycetota bacterium]